LPIGLASGRFERQSYAHAHAHAPWNHDHWDKRQATFDLASGAYLVTLLAHKCRVYYRVRLSVAP